MAQERFSSDKKFAEQLYALAERLIMEAKEQQVKLPPLIPRTRLAAKDLSHMYPGESFTAICGYVRQSDIPLDSGQPHCYRCLQLMLALDEIGIAE